MPNKIILKNSVVQDKVPLPTDLDVGELAVNLNENSPAIYGKNSAGAIVKLAGKGAVPDASEAVKGIVELATAAETTAGTDATRAVHPAGLRPELDKLVKKAGDTMTGALRLPAGTAAAPSLNFTGSTTTGLSSPVADSLVASTGGLQRLRLDADGTLIKGNTTSVPINSITHGFQIHGSPSNYGASFLIARYANDDAGSPITISKTRSNAVGVFGTSVQDGDTLGSLDFVADNGSNINNGAVSIRASVDGAPTASGVPGRLKFYTARSGQSQPQSRMYIGASGHVVIEANNFLSASSTTDPGFCYAPGGVVTISRSGNPALVIQRTASDGQAVQFYRQNTAVGSISVTTTTTTYGTSSDYRLKENVVPLTGAADRLKQLKPSRFNFIAEPGNTVDGFLAHEAQAVVPECVTGVKDEVDDDGQPVHQGIDQSKMVPLLTAALQEALAKIEALEARLSVLERS